MSSSTFVLPDPFFFHSVEDVQTSRVSRLQQLEVLQSELKSLRPGARVFQGGLTGTVFLEAKDSAQVKAGVRKELDELRKSTKGKEQTELNF